MKRAIAAEEAFIDAVANNNRMSRQWQHGHHANVEAVMEGVSTRRQRRKAARAVIGAVIGSGGWSATDLLPGRPIARDEQVVASTGCRDSCVAAGVDAEATSSCEGCREDERGVKVEGAHLHLCSCGLWIGSTAQVAHTEAAIQGL